MQYTSSIGIHSMQNWFVHFLPARMGDHQVYMEWHGMAWLRVVSLANGTMPQPFSTFSVIWKPSGRWRVTYLNVGYVLTCIAFMQCDSSGWGQIGVLDETTVWCERWRLNKAHPVLCSHGKHASYNFVLPMSWWRRSFRFRAFADLWTTPCRWRYRHSIGHTPRRQKVLYMLTCCVCTYAFVMPAKEAHQCECVWKRFDGSQQWERNEAQAIHQTFFIDRPLCLWMLSNRHCMCVVLAQGDFARISSIPFQFTYFSGNCPQHQVRLVEN